ncbi:MAG: TetR/AcrR family transcriptional regulator, partial [Pseudomonadota bacterium]
NDGYFNLKASDISAQAGLSEGSFYVYFEDKRQAALSVMSDFLKESVNPARDRGRASTAFEAIRSTNRLWINYAVEHPGLSRTLVQLVDSDEEFARDYAEINRRWHELVANSIVKRYPAEAAVDEQAILFAVVALGAMMDEVVRGIFVNKTYEHLLKYVPASESGEGLADALSVIWFRVLYPGVALPKDRRSKPSLLATLDGSVAQLSKAKRFSSG